MPPPRAVATQNLMGRTTANLNCEKVAAHPRRPHQPGYYLHTKEVRNSGRIGCGTSWFLGCFTIGNGRSSLHQVHITHRWINFILSHIKEKKWHHSKYFQYQDWS